MNKLVKIIAVILLVSFAIGVPTVRLYAQTATPTPTPTTNQTSGNSCDATCWQQKISDLQGKISSLQGQEKTLSTQIAVMDSQIQLTQYRIDATKQQIMNLTLSIQTANSKITTLQSSINDLTKVLLNRIVATYEVGQSQPFQILVSSNNISNFFTRENYLKIAQAHDKQLMYDTVQAKNDYANQKNIYETEKKQVEALNTQLEAYTTQLDQEKADKQQLLTETKGSEANYQQQLAAAQQQLAALASFANARVGSGGSIIPHEDLSDSWGPYYNQRDASWGNNYIGYSGSQVWSVGCLLTSYAMVSSHYGAVVTPAQVAANTSYFWSTTAEFDSPGPSPAGHAVTYITNPSIDTLKSDLQSGDIIIAGMSANGGPYPTHYSDHWVVLRGVGGDGSFIINDPWYQGGMGVSINDHYAGWTIIEARIYH